jgi:hypothetical protein
MSNQFIQVYDAITGITTQKKLTEAEITEIENANSLGNLSLEDSQSARKSALAKLAALGLTEEEIAAL